MLQLSFKDHVLSIMAERREERSSEDETKHFSDFTYGKIVRHLRVRTLAVMSCSTCWRLGV